MKKLYSVKGVVYLSTALLFFLILSVIYSCRKELKIVPLSAADSVDAARSWYETTYPVNNLLSVNNNLTTLGVNNNTAGNLITARILNPIGTIPENTNALVKMLLKCRLTQARFYITA